MHQSTFDASPRSHRSNNGASAAARLLWAGALVAGLSVGAFAQERASFTGNWSGSWSNSLGDQGESDLELAESADGTITGDWDGLKLKGERVNKNTAELRGKNDIGSYQISASVKEGKLVLQYFVNRLDGEGSYSGSSTLTRSGSGVPAAPSRTPPEPQKPKASPPAKTTRDDVEYEFVSIYMDGNMGYMKLALTAKKPDKVLNTQGIRLIAADGTEHKAPLIGVLKSSGLQTGRLPEGVRTIVEFRIGNVPSEIAQFATIMLPGVYGPNPRARLNNPVVLKGEFPVER
jgi:hypothetical protein